MDRLCRTFVVFAVVGITMAIGCHEQGVRPEPVTVIASTPAPVDERDQRFSQSDILGSVELAYLESALRCIKMTPQDLLYRKNLMPDMPYRLTAVDRLMANPIEVPFYTDRLAKDMSSSGTAADSALAIAARELDLVLPPVAIDRLQKVVLTEEQLKGLPKGVSDALRTATNDMEYATSLVEGAFAEMSKEGSESLKEHGANFDMYQGYEGVKREEIINGARIICMDLGAIRKSLETGSVFGKPASEFGLPEDAAKGGVLFYAKTDLGEVIVGDSGPNEYHRDFSLIMDIGGDDLYTCRAGGTDGLQQPQVALCIDMGGNNRFIARMEEKPSVREESDKLEPGNDRIELCQGAAFAGIGVLAVFGDGDNVFSAGDWSQGAAFLGVGVLLRSGKGNDSYQGLDLVQGASALGVGLLIDDKGDDKYKATFASQAFGSEGGFGLLLDMAGNDNYYAGGRYEDFPQRPKGSFITMSQGFGYGQRPGCSGGIGALIDNSGDDFHLLDNQFGMGGSYWYGFGMLVDDSGNDIYRTGKDGDYDGYTMGAPIHLAAACFIDKQGNDIYDGNKIGPAVGWDMSPGWLVDGGGDDAFSSDKVWNWIAGGVQNGCGFLVKKSGNMTFEGHSIPCGQTNRDNGSIGVLLNLGGNGSYKSVVEKMNGNVWWSGPAGDINSTWCIGIDEKVSPDFKSDSRLADWPARMPGLIPDLPAAPEAGVESVATTPHSAVIGSAAELVDKAKLAEALSLLESARAGDPVDPELLYELAALYCITDKVRAVADLTEAVKCGFSDVDRMVNDVGISDIREMPGYSEALAAAKANHLTPEEMDKLWADCVKEQGSHWEKSEVARNRFKGLGRPGIYYAIPKMVSAESYEQGWASGLVTHHGKTAVPVLMDYMKIKDKGLKRVIITLLGEIGDPRATEAILPYVGFSGLTDPACIALGLMKDKRAVPALLKLSQTERFKESELFRKLIAVALGRIADPSAVPHLVEGIKDRYFWVRYPSEEALVNIGAPAVPALIEVVKGGQFPANAHALAALGRIRDAKAYSVIMNELGGKDWAMRAFAAEALGELGDPDALLKLEEMKKTEAHPFVRHKIEWAIGKLGKKDGGK